MKQTTDSMVRHAEIGSRLLAIPSETTNAQNLELGRWLRVGSPNFFPIGPVESNGYMLALPDVLDICLVVALRAEIAVF